METEKKQTKWQTVVIACTGIGAIAAIFVTALLMGHDGTLVALGATVIGSIVAGALGYQVGKTNKG